MSILERIDGDNRIIKDLSNKELLELCTEIREKLVDTVSETGGHLASNLGVVELTVALHKVFDSPTDSIVFDVGHQVYTHKLLTGRLSNFDTLRQNGGISGFPNPEESEHDTFAAGHSGTSVAAAFGLAEAKRLSGDDSFTVAVIGDGSFTGGLVYEALNNAGRKKTKLIIVLNDNEMSISSNVGSFAKYLAAIRTNPTYYKVREGLVEIIDALPHGDSIHDRASEIKKVAKDYLYQSNFFEDLGFQYMGPIDGHNVKALVRALSGAKEFDTPVILHIQTKKGKGYAPAELHPEQFHGISRFDKQTGLPLSKPGTKSYSDAFGDALCDLAKKDSRICAITAAMELGTGLTQFARTYPRRFFDVGIAEEFAVTFAGGLARGELLPVFAVYSSFLQRAYDELVHDVAMQHQKVVLGVDRAGFVGEDGQSHQGLLDVAFLRTIPDSMIYSPSSYAELEIYLRRAALNGGKVVAVRYPRGYEGYLPASYEAKDENFSVFGKKTSKIAIVTYGSLFSESCKAIEKLKEYKIDVKIIKLGRVWPIDEGAVKEALKCETVLFFEEGIKSGGIGEAFATELLQKNFDGEYSHIAVDNSFVHHASVPELLTEYGLSAEKQVEEILRRV